MKSILIVLLSISSVALGQVGSAYFNSARATTGTLGIVTVGTSGGGAILTGTGGTLYVGGIAVGTGGGGGGTPGGGNGEIQFNNAGAFGGLGAVLPAANGGTGVSNAGTFTNASNSTITGGGTVSLGGFTLTVPATGNGALLGTTQTFDGAKTFSALITATAGISTGGAITAAGTELSLSATGTEGIVTTGTGALATKNLYVSQAALATGTLCTVDFAAEGIKHFAATGNITITGTNFPTEGAPARSATVIISAGTATRAITVTIPAGGWTFFGSTGTPSSLTANKKGLFSAMATGSASAIGSFAPEN